MKADPVSSLLPWFLSASLRASVAALVILSIQKALSVHLPAGWRFGLWFPFVLMLMVPALPGSPLSLERLWADGSTQMARGAAEIVDGFPVIAPGVSSAAGLSTEETNSIEPKNPGAISSPEFSLKILSPLDSFPPSHI